MPNGCVIKPIGSKHAFRQRILATRGFKHYLTFFAGKDLLYMMRSELKKLGFKDSPQPACYVFREHILRGIQSSPIDVWAWLPEWQRLRELISEF